MLRELLQEEHVVRLFAVVSEERRKRLPELRELVLGMRVEDGEGAEIDDLGRVAVVGECDGLPAAALATEVAKEILSVPQVGILLVLAQSGASLCLILLF